MLALFLFTMVDKSVHRHILADTRNWIQLYSVFVFPKWQRCLSRIKTARHMVVAAGAARCQLLGGLLVLGRCWLVWLFDNGFVLRCRRRAGPMTNSVQPNLNSIDAIRTFSFRRAAAGPASDFLRIPIPMLRSSRTNGFNNC